VRVREPGLLAAQEHGKMTAAEAATALEDMTRRQRYVRDIWS
jgi:sulfite reductase alpha subunit-like flavoprotein